MLSVTTPICLASVTIASNACVFSFATVNTKRDCVSLNNAVTASPVSVTSKPYSLPNTASHNATAKPPSDMSEADCTKPLRIAANTSC